MALFSEVYTEARQQEIKEKTDVQMDLFEKTLTRYGLTVDRSTYSHTYSYKYPRKITVYLRSKPHPLKGNAKLVKLLEVEGYREGLRVHRCRSVDQRTHEYKMMFYVEGSATIYIENGEEENHD